LPEGCLKVLVDAFGQKAAPAVAFGHQKIRMDSSQQVQVLAEASVLKKVQTVVSGPKTLLDEVYGLRKV